MDSFIINGTEFGIDREKSRLDLTPDGQGGREISLSIEGDPQTHAAVADAEDSAWSWSLYPPRFYLENFPVPGKDVFSIRLAGEDYAQYDIALYMMEHNPVEDVTLGIGSGMQVEIHGKVDLMGESAEFAIRWNAGK